MDESQPKTLYIGNLDGTASENLLVTLFGTMGTVKSCKIIRESGNDPYAFIEYSNYQAAKTALTAMNKRVILNKEIKVNWATNPGNQPKTDTSSHHHIFVGNLSPDIETETLREAFAPFGEISNCRIVRDPQTMKSKGYAFVSFTKRANAEFAITAMNGQSIGSRSIRINWSRESLKSNSGGPAGTGIKNNIRHTFDEVYNQSSPTNTTVYCGRFPPNVISEELMQKHFMLFGAIKDVRVFKDKGYAFIKFVKKESAARAIEHTHNSEVHGNHVKCFWGKGKSGGDKSSKNVAAAAVSSGTVNVAVLANATMPGQLMMQQQQQQQIAAAPAAAALPSQIMTPQPIATVAAAQYPYAISTMPGQLMTQQQQQQQIATAPASTLPSQMMTTQPIGTVAAAQYPYAASYQQMTYLYPQTAQPVFQGFHATQVQTPSMQEGYYPYAYASEQQAGAGAGYTMVQPNVAWGVVPGAVVSGVSAAAATPAAVNGTLAPQLVYSAQMPQYQIYNQ